jgi:hypothetical protein
MFTIKRKKKMSKEKLNITLTNNQMCYVLEILEGCTLDTIRDNCDDSFMNLNEAKNLLKKIIKRKHLLATKEEINEKMKKMLEE